MAYRGGGNEGDRGSDDYITSASVTSDDEYDTGGKSASASINGNDDLATWREVGSFCCCHSNFKARSLFILHILSFFTILYFFFAGIVLLASSVQILGGCYGARLLAENFDNPISNVMAGVIATSIFQSSTATNILIGSLAGSGLTVQQCIYMAMGANVGNTMTNSIFALVHFKSRTALELAIAGATINDIFYLLTIAIMLPLEMASKMLYRISAAVTSSYDDAGYRWKGLIEMIVEPLTNKIIIANKGITEAIISKKIGSCEERYPVFCEDSNETFDSCITGLISCDESTGHCPIFFSGEATQKSDQIKGAITLAIALLVITSCLYGMMFLIYRMLVETPVGIIARCSSFNTYVLMIYGCAFGLLLGNSSATESMLTPFVGMGIIELDQMFPWSLGSNVGSSLTTILLALSTGKEAFVQVALANFMFNVMGIIFWFAIPFMRTFPLHGALILGILANAWRVFPLIYVCIMFFGIPLMSISIIDLIQNSSKGIKAAGYIALSLLFILNICAFYWWFKADGRDKFLTFFSDADNDNQEDCSINEDESISVDGNVDGISAQKYEETGGTGQVPAPPGILRNHSSVDIVPVIKISKKGQRSLRNPLGRPSRSVNPVPALEIPSEDEVSAVGVSNNPLSFFDTLCRQPLEIFGKRPGTSCTQLKRAKRRKRTAKFKRRIEDA